MNTSNTIKAASDLADSAVAITDKARVATKQAADTVADEIESGVDSLRKTVPEALSRATAQAEDLARLGIARAGPVALCASRLCAWVTRRWATSRMSP